MIIENRSAGRKRKLLRRRVPAFAYAQTAYGVGYFICHHFVFYVGFRPSERQPRDNKNV